MPRGRRRFLDANHDDDRKEGLDLEPSRFSSGMKPAKIADAVQSDREDMLEVTAHELVGRKGAFVAETVFGVSVGKAHRLRSGYQNTVIADRGAADVASEIPHNRFPGAGRLSIYPPGFAPDRVRNLGVEFGRLRPQRFFHGPAESRSERVVGQEPIGLTRFIPLFAVRAERSAGHDIMNMGMELQLPTPGVKDADHAKFASQMLGPCGHRLEGLRTVGEEQIVEQLRPGGTDRSQVCRHRKGDEEIRDRQKSFGLAFCPLRGANAAATWTRSVMTTMIRVVGFQTRGADIDLPAQRRGAAAQDRQKGTALRRPEWWSRFRGIQPRRRLPCQPVGQNRHPLEATLELNSSVVTAARSRRVRRPR